MTSEYAVTLAMITERELNTHITAFAKTIGGGPLGVVQHRPEDCAQVTSCFRNVSRKIERDGGAGVFGWFFQHRVLADNSNLGYLLAIHHAVWHDNSGRLTDVTPFHVDPKHRPYGPEGLVVFLVDPHALPITTEQLIAPLATKFHSLGDDITLVRHVERLAQEEEALCQKIYRGVAEASGK